MLLLVMHVLMEGGCGGGFFGDRGSFGDNCSCICSGFGCGVGDFGLGPVAFSSRLRSAHPVERVGDLDDGLDLTPLDHRAVELLLRALA